MNNILSTNHKRNHDPKLCESLPSSGRRTQVISDLVLAMRHIRQAIERVRLAAASTGRDGPLRLYASVVFAGAEVYAAEELIQALLALDEPDGPRTPPPPRHSMEGQALG